MLRIPLDGVRRRVIEELVAGGHDDLAPAHLDVLRYPGPDGRRPSDLALEIGVTRQALNYLLGQLEQLDYLRRVDDPDDRRSKRIRLTERGHHAYGVMRATAEQIEVELEAHLGAADYATLRDLLARLADARIASTPVTASQQPEGRDAGPAQGPSPASR